MEIHYKRLRALSFVQIAMSVIFLGIGMIDGAVIRFVHVSLLYTPCWVATLAGVIGTMGLCLITSRRPSSLLVSAIWSLGVACALYSTMTVYIYHQGMQQLLIEKYKQAKYLNSTSFVKKDAEELEYTDHEKFALVLFSVTIVLSVFEIVLAAAICTHSSASYERPLSLPMHGMQNQEGRRNPRQGRARDSQEPPFQRFLGARPLEEALANQLQLTLAPRYSEM